MNSLVPYGMVSGTIGTFVQLYILDLGGTVLNVGFALTLATAVAIPAAIFWGSISDRLKRRRSMIAGSFSAIGALIVLFLFARSVPEVTFLYAGYSFINSAPSTPINLLILESQAKAKWASSYANYQALANIGNLIGLLASSIWSVFIPVRYLVLFLSFCSVAAAVVAAKLISEPELFLEGTAQVRHYSSILRRLTTDPLVFLRTPRMTHLRDTLKTLRADFAGDLRILYASILVFYFGTGLTLIFVALLSAKGVSDPLIFAASAINLIANVFAYRYFGTHLNRKNFLRDSVWSLVLRSAAYGSVGMIAYFLTGVAFYAFAVILQVLASGIASAVYYTTSTAMIYESLGVVDQGASLGVYTAFTGVATTLGTLASGYVAFYSAFYVTFLLSAASFALSAWITLRLRSTPFASG